ncbi:MAG: RluA family pseudouridine synthase [Lachnospiraceae bacterium]|nr:RluA family pseudouridine synthase [Lachnospiraceae bacterium]
MNEYVFVYGEDSEDPSDIRLDICVSSSVPGVSRSYAGELIEGENVLLNDRPCKKKSKTVTAGDRLTVKVPDSLTPDILPENIPLDILYEDDDVLVVNKPAGMVVHPAPGHFSGTLVNAAMYHCGNSLSGINGVMRPGVVHRIDMDTTGSVVMCKNDEAHRSLAEQFAKHSVNRRYDAVIIGHLKEETGTVETQIGRSRSDRKKMAVLDTGGKRAVTHYETVCEVKGYSHVRCVLETGRTHQIRVHMSYLGHPVLGDRIYGGMRPGVPEGRLFLHAGLLGFIHPRSGEYIETVAPLPEYYNKLLGANDIF